MGVGNRHTSPTRPITPDTSHHQHVPFKQMFMQRLHSIFVRDESRCRSPELHGDGVDDHSSWPCIQSDENPKSPRVSKDKARPITGLPRQATFKRQNSERRERLRVNEPLSAERRAISAARHVSTSCVRRRTRSSPPPTNPCRSSAPATAPTTESQKSEAETLEPQVEASEELHSPEYFHADSVFDYEERPSRPLSRTSSVSWLERDQERAQLLHELDTRWILNLSMHFRDKTHREKFFVTFAETPTRWRRVTVSCDYRNAEHGSLEMDLKELKSQRDKSLAIYEAVRESLPEIQFYETVTNLKLETSDGRLHVHVTEDVNEIISYPARSMVRHILDDDDRDARPMELCEKDIAFDSHLSGFVYKVWHGDKTYIKKEIPSPDTIDEFLYEINALHSLQHSENVIKLEAIILDDAKQVVKGLLIGYAERGAVVDLLYDNKGHIPWRHRELWARQAVTGLRDIHEEGYVQGDFTLSNVVVDDDNNAKIIDINRRGCPVGWEPPEIAQKIASNQRISMYIGEKSDLYQLGMTLWALAMDDDEPERHDPPLTAEEFPTEIPEWFCNIVRICLSQQPRDRLAAKELVKLFPKQEEIANDVVEHIDISQKLHAIQRPEPKQYIDPSDAVERDDLERFRQEEEFLCSPQSSKDDWTFTYPQSSLYEMESAGSTQEPQRGRTPGSRSGRFSIGERLTQQNEYLTNDQSLKDDELRRTDVEPGDSARCDEINLEDQSHLVRASTFSSDEWKALKEPSPPSTGLTSMTLTPTLLAKSPSPFRLPSWRRSHSECTPRTSRTQLLTESAIDSPQISPRLTSLALARPQSAEPIKSARSSNETIFPCDASVGETSFSATAYASSSSERFLDKIPAQAPEDMNEQAGLDATVNDFFVPIPTIAVHDSGYDEPTLHEMTKT